MDFWGGGVKHVYFPENVEYLGCFGMQLEIEEENKIRKCLDENLVIDKNLMIDDNNQEKNEN